MKTVLPPALPSHVIAHMDMDTFFVSVERLKNPTLLGQPVMVGGTGNRGVVASCSYEARRYGVHAGMPMAQARRLCPHAAILPGSFADYAYHSDQVRQVVQAEAPLLEFASIDEFYLDLTGMDRFFGAWAFATRLRQQVMHHTGLPVSLGMANTKSTAKIATSLSKPCGATHVQPGTEQAFLAPLPISKMPGAGPETVKLLQLHGLTTLGQLQQITPQRLEQLLGKWGLELWEKAHSAHASTVTPYSPRKSMSVEETFHTNTVDIPALVALLVSQTEGLAYDLRQAGKLTACVTVKIRYADFTTHTQQMRVPYTAQDRPLLAAAKHLFQDLYRQGTPVRLLGVGLSHLVPGGTQLSLLEDTPEQVALLQAADRMRTRYGHTAVRRATALKAWGRDAPYPHVPAKHVAGLGLVAAE